MKKNDLIKYLEQIKGDPEILLWNGLVGDWMSIDPKFIEGTLVKETLNGYLEACRLEKCVTRQDWNIKLTEDAIKELTKYHKANSKWECNEYVTDDDIKKGRYKKKRVVYIQPKLRGETAYDRLGSINY